MEGKVDDLHILDQHPALDHKLTWKLSVAMMVTGVLLEDICGYDGHRGFVGYGGHKDGYIIAVIDVTCMTPWSAYQNQRNESKKIQ